MRWAREEAGMSLTEVAAKLKLKTVTSETVQTWESGTAQPSYPQLEKLAYDIYKRPVVVFFFPSPPEGENIARKFRSLPEAQARQLPSRIRFLVRKAEVFGINLNELYGDRNPASRQIFRDFTLSPQSDMQENARAVREYLELPPKREQFSGVDKALRVWRDKIENVGVFVFKDNFGDDDFSGFCLHHELFPIIYLNNNMSKTRQIFTLFHELAHILMQENGVDFRQNIVHNSMETACNRFAGKVLVPDDEFDCALPENCAHDKAIKELADFCCVSRDVILRKLLDRGDISQDVYDKKTRRYYEEWKKIKAQKKKNTKGGGEYYTTQNAYFSPRYAKDALSQYYNRQISEYQFADYLGVKPRQISVFEKHILKGVVS